MQANIINAAPMAILRGTQDLSTRQLTPVAEAVPQHLPKIYIYAKKGPTTPTLVVGDSRTQIYDVDSFDLRKKWANHATVLSNAVNAEGNAQMLQRIIPTDAAPEASFYLSLDVLPTQLPVYERNDDGTFRTDSTGAKVATNLTANGYKVKWVVDSYPANVARQAFGQTSASAGDQVDATTGTQSIRYNILELKASSIGANGNNSGIRLWAPNELSQEAINTKVLTKELAYPFKISVINRALPTSTPAIVYSQFGEKSLTFTLKPGVIDPVTDKELYIGTTFLNSYQNVTDPKYPPVIGDFGAIAIHDVNIALLSKKFYDAEIANASEYAVDFTPGGAVGEEFCFNIIGGTSSNGAPYDTFSFDSGAGAIRLGELTNIFAANGSDGTMDDASFAVSVAAEVAKYGDTSSDLQDTAINVESIIYDSGFPLATKYALCNFIAVRKDTFVVLATHDVNETDLSASEEHSLAIALRTRLQMFPESDYFGTPVMRGMIMGRSGKLLNSQYAKHVPSTIEIATKSARYMGAGDGRWKSGFNFDGAPGSIISSMAEFNVTSTPATARNKDWDAGLNWIQAYDRRSFFFPALKTVYNDDTSVLNSYFTAMAICQINKVTQAVWRQFSGVSGLTNAQLVQKVNEETSKRLNNRFDNRYIIQPDAYFTDADLQRGYSWTLPVKIYAPNTMTVMTTSVHAYRAGDLTAV